MNLTESPEHQAFREEVRAFVRESLPSRGSREGGDETAWKAFWDRALERGYIYRNIPRRYGGSEQPVDLLRDWILGQEFAAAGVGFPPMDARGSMLVHTLLDHGTQEQQERFIPPTLRGELRWCQGYSEPSAGSDLAAIRSTAVLDGDHWVVNGQKIWTSGAHESHYMFGLFRTEPDASKHAGISYLLVDMTAPGIEVAPMKQMDGGMDFAQVFLTDVRVAEGNIVGRRGEGWRVSRSTLKYERQIIGSAEMLREHFDALVDLARRSTRRGRPAIEDPQVRIALGGIEGYVRSAELSNLRQLSGEASGRVGEIVPLMLMGKLFSTDTQEKIVLLALDLLGAGSLREPSAADVAHEGDPRSATYWVQQYMMALGISIAGGASNIQRNIIGERLLGLPRDLRRS